MKRKIVACTIGNCVHVAGVMNFLSIAEQEGYDTEFLGLTLSVDELLKEVKIKKPDYVGVSFRLTPEPLNNILKELKGKIDKEGLRDIKWIFGGNEPAAQVAKESGIFYKVFDGTEDLDEVIAFLRGNEKEEFEYYPQDLISRINSKYPYPIIRHHLGLPSVEDTVEAIKKIAESKVLDVISIAPDQNAQSFFFEPEKMDKRLDGAGGVPVRRKEDFIKMYEAAQRGNFPLLRCYSGTSNLIKFAELLKETINNAWAAIPLCWYSELDGRGPRSVRDAIYENQQAMKWHGERGIPVEVNEAHHWSLRDAHDAVGVAAFYLAAYNARKAGVKDFIAQFMFNVPPTLSPKMDIAKMLAKIELVKELEDVNFRVYRQVRAGLASFPSDLLMAKGQLAYSAYISMALKPHIYHVVGYCEAHHAAGAEEIIESCKIVRQIIKNSFLGMPDFEKDKEVIDRKERLKEDAMLIIEAIKELGKGFEDPLSSPDCIAEAIKIGILDAPHLKGSKAAKGTLTTKMYNGALYPYDPIKKRIISEKERIERLFCRI